MRLMNAHDDVTGPVNLGNPTQLTMLELAERVLHITGSRSKLVFEPLPENDPAQRQPDISTAKRLLDWQPTVSLDEGLRQTITWFESQMRLSLE